MKQRKMKVLLYLKKGGLDGSDKAPIMGHIALGGSTAQFSYKLSCNPGSWNPREGRMDGKSREAVEVNGELENLLLSVQSTYQSLLSRGCLFNVADAKGPFQGGVQTRCMLIKRLDMLIKEKGNHVGIDIREGAVHSYHSTRTHLQKFIQQECKVTDLAFSQLTENFIYEFGQYFLNEYGFQESISYNTAAHLKTVCRLAYCEGLANVLLFDKARISRGDKRLPKALGKEALNKLKTLNFEDSEEEMETTRDIFLFACYAGAAYYGLMELDKSHLVHDDEGSLWLKFNRHKTGVSCHVKLLSEVIRLIEKLHSDGRGTLLPCIKYKNYQICLKVLRLRVGISFPLIIRTARHTSATLITLEQGVPIEMMSKMLGHSNISMTKHYAKVTPQKLFEELNHLLSFTEDVQMSI